MAASAGGTGKPLSFVKRCFSRAKDDLNDEAEKVDLYEPSRQGCAFNNKE